MKTKVHKLDGSTDMNVSSLIVACSRKPLVKNLSSEGLRWTLAR